MRRAFLVLPTAALLALGLAIPLLNLPKAQLTKADETLIRHHLTLDQSNRQNVLWEPNSKLDPDGEGTYYFDLVGVTEVGNPYQSTEGCCYVIVYEKALADMDSDEYICRMSMESGNDWRCYLALGLDARSNVKIDPGMTGISPHIPVVTAEIAYNDNPEHEFYELTMNHDIGYAWELFELSGENLSLTLYSVSVHYSCTY